MKFWRRLRPDHVGPRFYRRGRAMAVRPWLLVSGGYLRAVVVDPSGAYDL